MPLDIVFYTQSPHLFVLECPLPETLDFIEMLEVGSSKKEKKEEEGVSKNSIHDC